LSKLLHLLCATAALAAAPAVAQDSFYKGKTFTVVIGYSPGGGYDSYGRMLARHINRHIDGRPEVIVQNLPGAGSLNAVRQLEGTHPKDGTYLTAFNPALILESLVDPNRIKVKFSDVAWIGSIAPEVRVCYAWHATGIKTWDDLVARKETVFGSTAKGTANYMNAATLRRVFDIKIRHVLGFPGSAEQKLALERGELDADCGSWSSLPVEWIAEKKIYPLVSFSPSRESSMPAEIPYAGKFVKTPEQNEVLEIFAASSEVGRPFIMSKAVPQDRIDMIRKAFDASLKDPQLLADAKKLNLPVQAMTGADAAKIIAHVYQASPENIAKVREITE
jgi:tripartite-type tricarboxylate transporter receptor subunit TctC